MKQLITILIILNTLIIIMLIGCSNNNPETQDQGNHNPTCVYQDNYSCQVHLINIKGHEYLVSYTSRSYGGTCIIHSESCPCQKQNKNENNNHH